MIATIIKYDAMVILLNVDTTNCTVINFVPFPSKVLSKFIYSKAMTHNQMSYSLFIFSIAFLDKFAILIGSFVCKVLPLWIYLSNLIKERTLIIVFNPIQVLIHYMLSLLAIDEELRNWISPIEVPIEPFAPPVIDLNDRDIKHFCNLCSCHHCSNEWRCLYYNFINLLFEQVALHFDSCFICLLDSHFSQWGITFHFKSLLWVHSVCSLPMSYHSYECQRRL